LPSGASSIEIAVHPPEPTDGARYRSYGLDIALEVQGSDAARASTAFDVSEAGREVVRYGFLSHFDGRDGQSDADLDFLLRLHITDVQLYDWMYRHDTLLPPQDESTDLMGKPISLPVVREKIRGCHRRGMRALAYGAVYAASAAFRDEHPDWGLYDGAGRPYQLIERFFIMDIARGSPWTDHLLGQFAGARSALDLDGFHLDSYGFPRQAISRQHAEPVLRSLEEDFPEFIKEARRRLGPACRLIFNNVNGWPVENTAHAPQDALYIEVWPPHTRYQNLAELVRKARLLCRDRPVIMAAYLAPFRTAPGTNDALNAALLLISSLAALGAQHLLFGEEQGVLTQGYYVDFSTIAPGALPRLAACCDFLVRHSEVLFDAGLRDVTATHLGGDFPAYTLAGASISCWAQPETVWPIIRESRQRKTVSLVNLTGNASDLWNEGKAEPTPRGGLELEIAVHGPVAQVWWASPDEDAGRPQRLESSLRHSTDGAWLHVRLPVLRFFGLLVVELG
jgi:dextranase